MAGREERGFAFVAALEPAVVLAVAPLLLFPDWRPPLTALALLALLLVWALRWGVSGRPWPSTSLNWPLLPLMLTIPMAATVTVFPDLTRPKLMGLILGLAVFKATAQAIQNRRQLALGVAAYTLVGLALVGVGLLGVGWPDKIAFVQPFVRRIPRLLVGLPGTYAEEGINANQLGGLLTLYLPLLLPWTLGNWQAGRRVAAIMSGLALLLLGVILLFTQSRGSWLGATTGMIVAYSLWRWGQTRQRPFLMLAPAATFLAVAATGFMLVSAAADSRSGLLAVTEMTTGEIAWAGRFELWTRALAVLREFPLTGCGLGSFRMVVQVLYPLVIAGPYTDVAHSHNMFLQTALDLGMFGLLAYVALLIAAGVVCGRALGRDAIRTACAAGLLGAIISLHVFGLTDVMALGSKPGVAFWMALGLVAALPRLADDIS